MSRKYLGEEFDIHGGGNDLKFPHHENEIAQNVGACDHSGAHYWLHANMLLLNGKKMSKSDGNSISPMELFTGNSAHVTKGYTPMVVRFFFLQAHYGSTLDMNDGALQASEKGYRRLMEAHKVLQTLNTATTEGGTLDAEIIELMDGAYEDMNDDFNAPKALARLFELATKINALKGGQLNIADVTEGVLLKLKQFYNDFIFSVLGLKDETVTAENGHSALDNVMQLVIELRAQARTSKDWATSDKIRDGLKEAGIQLKDSKEGTSWVKE
jgi:cysteinyl-tRNA synthetase